MQTWQHSGGGAHERTKGPFKDGGRPLDRRCDFYDLKPWGELEPGDSVALVERIFPPYDARGPNGPRELQEIASSLAVTPRPRAIGA